LENKEQFYILNAATAIEYIERDPSISSRLGGTGKDWNVDEVGDGNLNFVYIVVGPGGSLVLKQVC
jgi:5-methylthioribose kinase